MIERKAMGPVPVLIHGPRNEEENAVFEEIWQRHSDELLSRCVGWTGGHHEDAQEAFSRAAAVAFTRLPERAEGLVNVRAWLLKLTYHVCMDLHREKRRRKEHCFENLDEMSPSESFLTSAEHGTPEDSYLRIELQSYLHSCINALSDRLRVPIVLHAFSSMSYREIADRLVISEVNVRKRIQEARAFLRRRLADYRLGSSGVSIGEVRGGAGAAEKLRRGALEKVPEPARPSLHTLALRTVRVQLENGLEKDLTLRLSYPPEKVTARRMESLLAYIEKHPLGWKRRLKLARLLREKGELETALGHYRFVLERQGRELEIWLELASTLRALGRSREAREACLRGAGEVAGAGAAEHLRAWAALAGRDLPAAGAAFEKAAALEPRQAAHLAGLGRIHLEAGRPLQAAEVFERALELAPEDVELLTWSHDALEAAGRPLAALARLCRAIDLDAESFPALRRLAEHRCRAGLVSGDAHQRTEELLGRLGRLAGERADSHHACALYRLARGEEDEAIASLRGYLEEHPRHAEGWRLYARVLFHCGRYLPAAEAAATALALEPARRSALLDGCRILPGAGRLEEGRRWLEAMVEARPEDGTVLLEAAWGLVRWWGDERRALALAARASELQPRLPATWFGRGKVCARAGRRRQALASLLEGWAHLPEEDGYGDSTPAALLIAECYADRGDRLEARKWCLRTIEHAGKLYALDPAWALALEVKAQAALGDRAAALRAYRSALRRHPSRPLRAEIDALAGSLDR